MPGVALSDALQRVGASRVEAALLDLLSREPDVSTKEAVEATGLRQPEVSVGMRELVDRDWVECAPIPREGRGRPMHRYRLVASSAQLLTHYEALGRQAKVDLEHAMQTLVATWARP